MTDANAADDRRRWIAGLTSVVLLVVVTAVVALFGVRRPPELPLVADQQGHAVPGTLALLYHDERGRTCVDTVPAGGGEVATLICSGAETGWIEALTWTPDGDVVLLRHDGHEPVGDQPPRRTAVVVTVPDGEIVAEVPGPPSDHPPPFPPGRPAREDGTQLLPSGGPDGVAMLRARAPDGSSRTLLELDGPQDYSFVDARWSPDGRWILVRDSEERFIVLGEDGDAGPWLLLDRGGRNARYVADVAWFVPGETADTFDPDAHGDGPEGS